jgi:hypothetical protein
MLGIKPIWGAAVLHQQQQQGYQLLYVLMGIQQGAFHLGSSQAFG